MAGRVLPNARSAARRPRHRHFGVSFFFQSDREARGGGCGLTASRTDCHRGCEHLPLPLPLAFARLTRLVPTLAPQQRPHLLDGLRCRGLPTLPPHRREGSGELAVVDATRCNARPEGSQARVLAAACGRLRRGRSGLTRLSRGRALLRRWGPLARCCRRCAACRCAACRRRRRRRRCCCCRRRCATCRRQPATFQATSESAARLE